MAYLSPSPQMSPTLPASKAPHSSRLGAMQTTTTTTQPISKRDKRRMATMDRLHDIENSFDQNRELHFRTQLEQISRDMMYILRASLYETKTLNDDFDDANSATESGSEGRRGPGSFTSRGPLGKWASLFINEVNGAMEERDSHITQVFTHYESKLQSLQEERDFRIAVALEEHRALERSVRDRAIMHVNRKRAQLAREKDSLDIADTNSLLFNPAQFSITHPASPAGNLGVGGANNGGGMTKRNTRQGRNANNKFDSLIDETSGRRKRKAPADFDLGSPAPNLRIIELDGNYNERGTIGSTLGSNGNGDNQPTPLSIDKLFPPRELANITKGAYDITAQNISKRARLQNQTPHPGTSTLFPSQNPSLASGIAVSTLTTSLANNVGTLRQTFLDAPNPQAHHQSSTNEHPAPSSTSSTPPPQPNNTHLTALFNASNNLNHNPTAAHLPAHLQPLTAPEMNRTASVQSTHMTRSTQRGLYQPILSSTTSLAEVRAAARNHALGLIAAQQKLSRFKESDSLALGLTGAEMDDDLLRMGVGGAGGTNGVSGGSGAGGEGRGGGLNGVGGGVEIGFGS
ncbi:hypothetical protein MMC25_006056 [Agyrium rufum]|nr:hypothetical protein [Agyrium rufum]